MRHSWGTSMGLLWVLGALSCTGKIVSAPGSEGISVPTDSPIAMAGARRLSKDEYDNALAGFAFLPEDAHDPFDNNYLAQLASPALIDAAETLATDAMTRVLADGTKRAVLVPCTPKGADDAVCLRAFIQTFGRRVLRQPLAEEELQAYLALGAFAVKKNDFFVGVEAVGRALLQDPEFLYRVETGAPVGDHAGVFRLGPYELATRLSCSRWGSTPPPDWLLDLAQSGKLGTTAQVHTAA